MSGRPPDQRVPGRHGSSSQADERRDSAKQGEAHETYRKPASYPSSMSSLLNRSDQRPDDLHSLPPLRQTVSRTDGNQATRSLHRPYEQVDGEAQSSSHSSDQWKRHSIPPPRSEGGPRLDSGSVRSPEWTRGTPRLPEPTLSSDGLGPPIRRSDPYNRSPVARSSGVVVGNPELSYAAAPPVLSASPVAHAAVLDSRLGPPVGRPTYPPRLLHSQSSSSATAQHSSYGSSSAHGSNSSLTVDGTSPNSSYSSYTPMERKSPEAGHADQALKSTTKKTSNVTTEPQSQSSTGPSAAPQGEDLGYRAGISMSTSAGQNTYQMLTFQTFAGAVQVPVDVQLASRVADEKRKRNAGASARFRERRKRKEVEASTTIRRLEQQLKDVTEDADHYRRERDYFRDAVAQAQLPDRIFARPTTSPRLTRATTDGALTDGGSVSDSGFNYAQEKMEDMDDDEEEEDRHGIIRQRTSSFTSHAEMPPLQSVRPSTDNFLLSRTTTHRAPWPGGPHSPYERHDEIPIRPVSMTAQSMAGVLSRQPNRETLPSINSLAPNVMQASPTTGPANPFAGPRMDNSWPAASRQGPPR